MAPMSVGLQVPGEAVGANEIVEDFVAVKVEFVAVTSPASTSPPACADV